MPYAIDPQTGDLLELGSEADIQALGYKPASAEQIATGQAAAARREKFGTTAQELATFGEKAASALTLGLSTAAERALGVSAEDIRARAEINPAAATAGTVAGIAAPLLITGGGTAPEAAAQVGLRGALRGAAEMTAPALISRLGRAATRGVAEAAPEAIGIPGRLLSGALQAETGLARQIAARAVATGIGSAVEGAAYGVGQVVEESALGDPNLTAQSAIATIGLSAVLGGGLGAAMPIAEGGVSAAVRRSREAIDSLWGTGKGALKRAYGAAERVTGTPGSTAELMIDNAVKIREMSRGTAGRTDFGRILADSRTKPEMAQHILANSDRYVALEQAFPGTTRQLAPASPEMAEKMLQNFPKIITDPSVRMKIAKEAAQQTTDVIQSVDGAIKSSNIALKKNAGKLLEDASPVAVRDSYHKLMGGLDDMIGKMRAQPELFDQWHAKFAEGLREGLERDANKMVGTAYTIDRAFLRLKNLRTQIGNEIKWKSFNIEAMSPAERSSNQLFQSFYHEVKNTLHDPGVFGKTASIQTGLDDLQTAWRAAKGRESGFKSAFLDPKGKVKATKVNTWFNQMADLRGEQSSEAWGGMMSAARKSLDAIEELERRVPVKGFSRSSLDDLLTRTQDQTIAASERAAATQAMNQLKPSPSFGSYGSYAVTPGDREAQQILTGPVGWIKSGFHAVTSFRQVDKTVAVLAALEKAGQTTSRLIDRGVSRVLSSKAVRLSVAVGRAEAMAAISRSLPSKASQTQFERRISEIQRLAGDPETMHRTLTQSVGSLDQHSPNVSQSLSITSARGIAFLASKIPPAPDAGLWSSDWKPSPAEIAKFNRYYEAVNRPLSILKQAAAGTLTAEAIEAVSAVYPELMMKIRASALEKAAGRKTAPPYHARQALATLLGQDVDGSMTPFAITANQASHAAPSSRSKENRAIPDLPKLKPNIKGLSNISISKRALTPMQRSAQRD